MDYRNLKVASYKQNKGLLDNRMKSREENRTLDVWILFLTMKIIRL